MMTKIQGVMRIVNGNCWLLALAMVGLVVSVAGVATAPAQAPPGAVTAEIGFPPVGAKFEYRTVEDGATKTQIFTVLEEGTYRGKPVFRMSDGVETLLYDKATESWMATLREGKVVSEASPHAGSMSFPLWVGKSWASDYSFTDHEQGINAPNETRRCKVAAHEEVKVPAGTFMAFRVECSTRFTDLTFWYSAELHKFVKHVFERNSPRYGSQKKTMELLSYRLR